MSTTAAAMTQARIVASGPVRIRTYMPTATPWVSVLTLPPRLAGITPCRITQKRSSVMPSSRARMTIVTHQGRSPSADRPMSAAPMIALSAIGSAILPKSVTSP